MYEKSKLVSRGFFVAGRLPERLLLPRNRKLSEGRLKIDRGIWPVILLKLKSSNVKFTNLEKSTNESVPNILLFLNTLQVR